MPEMRTNPQFLATNQIVQTTTVRDAAPSDVARRRAQIKAWQKEQSRIRSLSDADKRRTYDRFGHTGLGGRSPFGGAGGINFGDFDFGGAGGARSPFSGLEDIFGDLFGGGRSRRRAHGPRRGQNIEYSLELSFEEAVHGVSKRLTVQNGDGERQSINVKIPAGVKTGSKVRVAGKGAKGTTGASPGDLYIITKVKNHPFYERQSDDVYCTIPVTIAEAALGSRIEVPTIDGPTRMVIPAGTQSGQKFRLRERGVPHFKGGGRGDQFVTVSIVYRKDLDERSKELLREFDQLNATNPRDDLPY